MLFGQWQDEKDRQRKQIKTKMYKEMLDNQILINQRYKREKRSNKEEHNESQISQKRLAMRKQHFKTENSYGELDLTLSKIRTKSNHVNLPSIKDKNTYYQGSKQTAPKPASQSPFHAEMVQEEEEDLDEYNSTCEKIIRQLKSINKQTPKMKYRRKLYEYSDLAPNRKRYEKTKIEELKKSEVQLYNKYDYVRTDAKQDSLKNELSQLDSFSTKSKLGPDDRIPSFSMVSPSKQAQSEVGRAKQQKPIYNQSKFKPKQEYPANQFQQVSIPHINTDTTAKQSKLMTQPSDSSTIHMSANLPAKMSNLERSRIKSNIDITKNPQTQTISQRERLQQPKGDLKMHKQNFINLLRKVKNRGQSLFIKLNAFPMKSEIKKDKQ